jgi:agmatine deiminase
VWGFVICDERTNLVYVSDLLPKRFPDVHRQLHSVLKDQLRLIPGTRDIWCRDYMPIQLDADRFVQFRYDPDYLKEYPHLRTEDAASLLGLKSCVRSKLVIDGGNVVHHQSTAIVTDKIYKENLAIDRSRLREQLKSALEVDRLIVIPKEPYDKIGHADGMVRFVDEKTLLVNDYSKVDPAFGKRLATALKGFELIPLPYVATGEVFDGIDSAEGVYINFLCTVGTLFLPTFGWDEDRLTCDVIRQVFPALDIAPIRADKLSKYGGVVNCATWNIFKLL